MKRFSFSIRMVYLCPYICMIDITQHPVRRIYLKQFDLLDLMSEDEAHQRMRQFVDGRPDKTRDIAHQGRFAAQTRVKHLVTRGDHHSEHTKQSGGERHVQKIEDKNVKSRIHSLCCRFNSEDCCSSMSTPSMQS